LSVFQGLFADRYNTVPDSNGEPIVNSATLTEELGIYMAISTDGKLKIYKYIQAAADTTIADGTALCHLTGSNYDGYTASSDRTDNNENLPMGVGIGAITAAYYGWILVYGEHDAILTDGDGDIAEGDSLIIHATTDGVVDTTATGTAPKSKPLGICLTDDTATTVHGLVTCFP
jgi:hypothetical protein